MNFVFNSHYVTAREHRHWEINIGAGDAVVPQESSQ